MTASRPAPRTMLGFGGAPLGDMFARIDEDTAAATVTAAWDAGIRYFDTAPHYGTGLSEHRMGRVLRDYPRGDYELSTKVGRILVGSADAQPSHPFLSTLPFKVHYDYSAAGARRSVEDSLQRMAVGSIDFVYVHDLAEDHHGKDYPEYYRIARDGAFKELVRMREEGLIRGWGLGVNLPEPCVQALQDSDPDVFLLAGRYSLLDLRGLDELFPLCAERGARVVVGGPYNSGLLAGGKHFDYQEAPPEQVAARDRIQAVCNRFGVDIRAAALQFCAAHPVVAAIIPGAKAPERVRKNAELMQAAIPAEFWQALKAEAILPADVPTP